MRTVKTSCLGFPAVLFLVVIFFAVGGCSGEKSEKEPAADTVKTSDDEKDSFKTVPADLVMHRLDGKEVSMGEYRGKLVVMYFWASWHNDSRTLVEIMNAIHRRYARSYEFLAVSMDKGGEPVIWNFMREEYILCDVFVNGDEIAQGVNGIGKLPTLLVILRDGRIVRRMEGLYRRKQYEELLTGMLRYRN